MKRERTERAPANNSALTIESAASGLKGNIKVASLVNTILPFVGEHAIFFALALACGVFALLSPVFLSATNLFNVVRVMSIDGMLALGMTFVILTKGIDLSVGSVLALSGAIAAALIPRIGLEAGVVLAVCAVIGALTGLTITTFSLQPFLATLGVMVIARGLTFIITGGYPVLIDSNRFDFLGNGYVGPVPVPIIIFVIIVVVGHLALGRTVLGKKIYAIGGNPEAARRFGINVSRVTITTYVICGSLAAVAGVILASRLSSASPVAGMGYELDAIAAVVIGGTSLMGGRGNILGTVAGIAIMAVMNNGLTILNVDPNYQLIVKGLIILAAVSADGYFHRRRY
jgi:ribose/xylose/arabinose/galactoside ABC-type transport system permease subunit